jgi:hypothetical protein
MRLCSRSACRHCDLTAFEPWACWQQPGRPRDDLLAERPAERLIVAQVILEREEQDEHGRDADDDESVHADVRGGRKRGHR